VGGEGNLGDGRLAAELAPTFAELVRSTPVLQGTIDSLGLRRAPDDLKPNVRGESDRETRLLTIRARDRDARLAVVTANALTAALARFVSDPSQVSETDEPGGSAARPAELRVVERATEAHRVRPHLQLLMEFGALAACFVSIAAALIVESLRRTVRGEEDLNRLGPSPVLGSVNGGPLSGTAGRALLGAGRAGKGTEAYRRLAARVAVRDRGGPARSVLVLGAQGDAGGGAVAANLASAWAQTGPRVVLADLSEATEAVRLFRRRRWPDRAARLENVAPLRHRGVVFERFAPAGERGPLLVVPRDGARALDPADARALFELLLAEADVLVVLAGSPAHSPGSLALARAADVAVVVVRRGRTRSDSVGTALENLESVGANVVGTVLLTGEHWV
jgi:capsular polysaccharide biosynthesis protein